MIEIVVRIALAGVLGGAALAKLASPRSSEAALATFGFGEGPLRRVAWAGLIALELGLAIAVAAGVDTAAYGAAALMAMFAALMGSALMRGRAGAPCACFGSRSRVSRLAIARNLALAAGFAAVPSLPDDSLTTDQWLGLGLGVALVAIAVLAVAVLALTREVGMLRLQAASQGALEIAGEGPELGEQAPRLSELISRDPDQLALAVFTSEGCHLCRSLEPAIESLAAEPGLALATFDEHRDEQLWRELGVPGSPFALVLAADGAVLAKGTFNNLAQLESVVATAERRRSDAELRVFQSVPDA
jgi:thiol-disulfide isomerase/thioredoxin